MEPADSYDGSPFVRAMVDRLEQRTASIDELRRAHDVTVIVRLNASVDPNDSIPAVYLDQQLLARMANLSIDFELDFTMLAPS
jgi:hypothetical protein